MPERSRGLIRKSQPGEDLTINCRETHRFKSCPPRRQRFSRACTHILCLNCPQTSPGLSSVHPLKLGWSPLQSVCLAWRPQPWRGARVWRQRTACSLAHFTSSTKCRGFQLCTVSGVKNRCGACVFVCAVRQPSVRRATCVHSYTRRMPKEATAGSFDLMSSQSNQARMAMLGRSL